MENTPGQYQFLEMRLSEIKTYLSETLGKPFKEFGYTFKKTSFTFKKKIGNNTVEFIFDFINYAPLRYEINFAIAPSSALNSKGPQPIAMLEKEFGTTFTHGLTVDQIKSRVGTSGQAGIIFGNRGSGKVGHVFNVINDNGTIKFIDGQTRRSANLNNGYVNFSFLPTNK
jgi:hypothetical protein